MAKRSFTRFVEQELGKFPHFIIYALLEWVMIFFLFVDGFISFFTNEFAKFFDLRTPCLLCTRIDHVLVHRNNPDFYYNDSMCESHKKDVSSLAYCHNHKKLSDIRKMCESCLLSFATERESDCDTYKSLIGILHKDLDCFLGDDQVQLSLSDSKPDQTAAAAEEQNTASFGKYRCSCCGKSLKPKSSSNAQNRGGTARHPSLISHGPTPSPRASFTYSRGGENRGLELPHIRYTELKFMSDNESQLPDDDDASQRSLSDSQFREDVKAATVPLLTEPDYMNEDAVKTPSFIRGNRFFGIPLTDSASNSPRIGFRSFKKSPLEKTEFATESMMETNAMMHEDGDSILHHLKRQVRLDRKSLMALYMELDEERSASAVAANNAMAMITRLQAEKASVQMEALQYQRMMEEQAEYDQEALQATNDMLVKREEDLKALDAELEAYREKYGPLNEEDFKRRQPQDETDEECQQFKPHPYSFESGDTSLVGSNAGGEATNGELSQKPEPALPTPPPPPSSSQHGDSGRGNHNESLKDFKEEKTYLLGRKRLEKKSHISDNGGSTSPSAASDGVDNIIDDDQGCEGKSTLFKELCYISEKVKAIEAAGGSLDRVAEKLEKQGEGNKLLTEISQSLVRLRHVMTMISDQDDDE